MNQTARIAIGIGLFLIAVIAVVAFKYMGGDGSSVVGTTFTRTCANPITVTGYYGGEKSSFLKDPEVQQILKDRYCIVVNGKKSGSTEMVRDIPLTPQDDFLWPSNMVSLALYKERGGAIEGYANIFNSPLVLYSHKPIVDALIKEGIVAKQDETYYVVDFPKLIDYVRQGKTWKDIGLPMMAGSMSIHTTDPLYSNSGFMTAGLIATVLNNGNLPNEAAVRAHMPALVEFFRRGFMDQSSGDLFQQYLTTGMGAKPLVAGYESQLIEFKISRPDLRAQIDGQYVTLYPVPTVWSSHPLIARTSNGKKLLEALKDEDLQRIAWTKHGFRSGLVGAANDPKLLGMKDVPADITAVADMPSPGVMELILQALAGK
ncbi:MAG: hypothetical protein AB7W16_25415 [Candidatus Obscuribacterales bacterium]